MSETPLADLTAFQRDVLVVVAKSDGLHGLGVKAALQDVRDEEINHGRLYPNLDDLVEYGYVDKSVRDRRTNDYSITADGRRAIAGHIEWLVAADEGGAGQ